MCKEQKMYQLDCRNTGDNKKRERREVKGGPTDCHAGSKFSLFTLSQESENRQSEDERKREKSGKEGKRVGREEMGLAWMDDG